MCFSTSQCQNLDYRQRSQTLQPNFRRDVWGKLPNPNSKQYMLAKFLNSTQDPNGAYANVHQELPEEPLILPHHLNNHTPRSIHQYSHSQGHSQHHYHTTYRADDPSNYYNISTIEPAIIPTRPKHVSHIIEPIHNPPTPLDSLAVMQVCNELGYDLDSNPQIPPSRNYTVFRSAGRHLYKNTFPQRRLMRDYYTDPVTQASLPPYSMIDVLGVSKKDRSMFFVKYNDLHVDVPHLLTRQESI